MQDEELWTRHTPTIDAALGPLEAKATEMQRRWGQTRLMRLAGSAVAVLFASAQGKLDEAVLSRDPARVVNRAEILARGWDALEQAALAAGHEPYPDGCWGVTFEGVDYVIAKRREDAQAIAAGSDHPERVITINELMVTYTEHQAAPAVNVVKMAFPGAQVSRVGPKYNRMANKGARKAVGALSEWLDDDLPF